MISIRTFGAALALSASLATGAANAALIAQYHLGESGSMSGGLPLDSSGNGHDFLNSQNGGGIGTTGSVAAPGSTVALTLPGNAGYYGTAGFFGPSDNFEVDLWANASGQQAGNNFTSIFASAGGFTTGTLFIGVIDTSGSDNWVAFYHNEAWIGGAAGAGQPVTVGQWTHLQVQSLDGISTFYINGVASGPTVATQPIAWSGTHLGVTPGGGTAFFGAHDEVRIATIPEPASLGMLALGGLALLCRRK